MHHVTREEFEKKIEERRVVEAQESSSRFDDELHAKMATRQRAAERSTGKRMLQAAAAMRLETDMEQSLAKVRPICLIDVKKR